MLDLAHDIVIFAKTLEALVGARDTLTTESEPLGLKLFVYLGSAIGSGGDLSRKSKDIWELLLQ